jgi:putative membrane protein insertion efficiency factor
MVASGKACFYPNALMVFLIRFLIRLYQFTLSPLLSFVGGPAGCRFEPTCSAYFLEAVETHGCVRGSWLGLKRLVRCQPWGGSGHDPVPERGPSSPDFASFPTGKMDQLEGLPATSRTNLCE